MYLFLTLLASQIALHSWLHVKTYQKNQLEKIEQVKQRIMYYSDFMIGKYVIFKQSATISYEFPKLQKVTPQPTNFDSRLFDQFCQCQNNSHWVWYGKVRFFLEQITAECQVKRGNTCEIGPNKNDFVFYDDGSCCIINNKKSFPQNIKISGQFQFPHEKSVYSYAHALAYYKNRYAIITREKKPQAGEIADINLQDSIEIHDFIFNDKKIKDKKIADIPLETLISPPHYFPSAFWHNLSFIGNDTLFFVARENDGSLYGNSHLYKVVISPSCRPKKIVDSVISFAAHPMLPVGFMLKKLDDETYPLYVANACTSHYKKIDVIQAEQCHRCKQLALIPRDMVYDGYILGIKFAHLGGHYDPGTQCSSHCDVAFQLKTIPIVVWKK